MILDELSFGIFREIEPNIMEITINEGVELKRQHIERIEEGLLEKYSSSYALLINRVNSYSHTHDSMQKVAKLQNLAALAIVVYSNVSGYSAKLHGLFQDNVQVFEAKDVAMAWLRNSLKKHLSAKGSRQPG
jgi:hypothetical protein